MSRRRPAPRAAPVGRGRDDDPLAIFVRGATVGAFVGAVIAGSTAWHRIRQRVSGRTAARPPGPDPASSGRVPADPPRPDGGAGRQ